MKTMNNPNCPVSGAKMYRDFRPMTLTYKEASIVFEMPGWFCDQSDESIHTGEDKKVSDRALNQLKTRSEGLFGAKEF